MPPRTGSDVIAPRLLIAAKEHRRRLAQRYLITLRRAEQINFRLWTASVGGLFHFKLSVQCLLVADFIAKVGGPLQVRNFRIHWARRLNQYCASGCEKSFCNNIGWKNGHDAVLSSAVSLFRWVNGTV